MESYSGKATGVDASIADDASSLVVADFFA